MYILTIVENTRFLKHLAPSARHRQIVPGHPTVQVEALALAKFTSEPMKKYFAGMLKRASFYLDGTIKTTKAK
jgi:hypothetical protein